MNAAKPMKADMEPNTNPQHGTALSPAQRMRRLPMPRPDQALYDAVLTEGFRLFPERRANFERFKAAKRGEAVDYLPVKLDIENVSRCNYRCTMCQVSDWPRSQRAEDMSLEDFVRLLDEQTGLVEIKLQGMGEPLMGGEAYFAMIREARARGIWVRSTTNGSLLRTSENFKKVVDSDICELQVSVDGATPATYETIRRGGNFRIVQRNCSELNDYARNVGRHRTRMWTVVQRENFNELERFPVVAADMGFARLTLSLDLNDWGQDRWRAHNDAVDVHRDLTAERAEALVAEGARRGVEVSFWFIDEKYSVAQPEKLCGWPFERAYISSDMRVVPCCMISNPQIMDLGSARDFAAVWNGPEMRAFRRAHLEGKVPDICRTCYKDN